MFSVCFFFLWLSIVAARCYGCWELVIRNDEETTTNNNNYWRLFFFLYLWLKSCNLQQFEQRIIYPTDFNGLLGLLYAFASVIGGWLFNVIFIARLHFSIFIAFFLSDCLCVYLFHYCYLFFLNRMLRCS